MPLHLYERPISFCQLKEKSKKGFGLLWKKAKSRNSLHILFYGECSSIAVRVSLSKSFPDKTQHLSIKLPYHWTVSVSTCVLSWFILSMEKAMASHSSTLAWKIPRMEEPGRLQSLGSHRVGHDWETSLSLFTFMHWRRKWQPTPVFLPGESQGRGSLVGCRLWGHTESDKTEVT